MRKMMMGIGLGLVSLVLTGCTLRLVDFTAISTKNVEVAGTRGERVQGKDMKWIILWFPTGKPDMKEAIDRAIERGGGDMLVDGVIYNKGWYALVVGQTGYVVEGTVVNTKRK